MRKHKHKYIILGTMRTLFDDAMVRVSECKTCGEKETILLAREEHKILCKARQESEPLEHEDSATLPQSPAQEESQIVDTTTANTISNR